jgi:hypothetical protein
MAVQTIATTVGTTATRIYNYTTAQFAGPGTAPMWISNLSAAPVFVGGPTVTATTGVQIAAGANLSMPTLDDSLYAVVATGTANVVVGVFT